MRITIQPKTVTPLRLIGWAMSWLCLTDNEPHGPRNPKRSILLERCCTAIKCNICPTLWLEYASVLVPVLSSAAGQPAV